MLRCIKVRLFPNAKQEAMMWEHINAYRFVYNWGLEKSIKHYVDTEKALGLKALSKELTQFKKTPEGSFLNKVEALMLVHALHDLDYAYTSFFREIKKNGRKYPKNFKKKEGRPTFYYTIGYPKFKSSKSPKVACYIRDRVWFDGEHMRLEKMGKLAFKSSAELPKGRLVMKAKNPRLSLVNGKWMLLFSRDIEKQDAVLGNFSIGVDLGIKTLMYVSSDDRKVNMQIANINKEKCVKTIEKQILRYNRKHSKTIKDSNRREKVRIKLSKKYLKLINMRNDRIHKATHAIVSLLPKRIVVEDLNIEGMIKNRHLSKAIRDCRFAEIYKQLEYKSEERGIEFVVADRFFPSSKNCSCCGSYKKDLTLKHRVYTCDKCGTSLDRDLNAAINLSQYEASKDSLVLKLGS